MKKVLRLILGIVEFAVAAFFFFHITSDIQLGFAITFFFLSMSAFISIL